MPAKSPPLLTAEQRAAFVQIPPDLPDREIARHHTLTTADLAVIARHRQPHNRLGFAVQLCLLRFPGRTLTEVGVLPQRMLAYIAAQVQVDPRLFPLYGQREPTLHEHMAEIRQTFGYRDCTGLDFLHLARLLLPDALAQTHSLPLLLHPQHVVARQFKLTQQDAGLPQAMTPVDRLVPSCPCSPSYH